MEVANNPEDPAAGTAWSPFGRELWIERDDFMEEPAAEVLPPRAGPRGAAAVGVLRHLPRGRQGRDGRGRRAALHVRPGDARRRRARRPPAQGDPALGLGRARRARPRSGSTTTSSRGPIPGADGDLFADLEPASETIVHGRCVEPPLADAAGRRDGPVRAARLLLRRPGLAARRARLQPDGDAQGHLGQGPGAGERRRWPPPVEPPWHRVDSGPQRARWRVA